MAKLVGCRLLIGGGSGLGTRVELIEGGNETADAVLEFTSVFRYSGVATRSVLSLVLSFPRNRANRPCDDLATLGDLCADGLSRVMSERELGVGLDGRPGRLILEAKAELNAEGYCWFWFWRML